MNSKYLKFFLESEDEEEKKTQETEDDKEEKKENDEDKEKENDDFNNFIDEEDDDSDDDDSDDDDSDDDDSDEDNELFDKIAKAGYAYTLISNNMKYVHLNASGKKFREIHGMADNYHTHFRYMSDALFELASESPSIKLDNPTRSKEHCEDIEVETASIYDFNSAMKVFSNNLKLALEYIEEIREEASSRTDIQSKMDEETSYLNKELNYFIRKMMGTGDSVVESYNYLF